MLPRMTALIALLALLLSGPACRAESLGDVPQVVDAGADKPVIAPPSQPPGPPLAPDKNGREAAAEVENQRRFNELRRELLDGRDKLVDQWLIVVAIVLTAMGVLAPIVGLIIGFLGFQRFRQIETEALQHLEEAERLVGEIREKRDEVALAEDLSSERFGDNLSESVRAAVRVQEDPTASPIAQAIAAAGLLQQRGEIEEAIEKWRSIANVAGEADRQLQARAWFSIGYLYGQGEGADLEAEVDAYTRAIELNPAYADAYNNRGVAKGRLDQPEAALADLDRAIELNPALPKAYNNRGNAKHALDRHEEAIADYSRAIELNPTYAIAYNNRGIVKHTLNRYEEAIADYSRAIELNPTYAIAYNNRGNAKHALDRHEEAITDYSRAIALDPTLVLAYNNRGNAKHALDRHEEAIADYSRAIELNPTDADAYNNRARTNHALDRPEAALVDLDRVIELNPTDAIAYNNRAAAKESLGRINEARADLQQAVVLARESGNENAVTTAERNLSRLDESAGS